MAQTTLTDLANVVNESFGQYITENVVKEGFDGKVLAKESVLGRLRARGRVKVQEGGENAFKWSPHYGGATAEEFSAGDPLPANTAETYGEATLAWARHWVTVQMDRLAVNAALSGAGIEGFMGALMQEVDAKSRELISKIERSCYVAGTGTFKGIPAFVSDNQTYAGINQATSSWWQAIVDDASGASITAALARPIARTLYDRTAKPTAIYSSALQAQRYAATLGNNIRYQSYSLGDSEFSALAFDGVPIIEIPSYTNTRWDWVDENRMAFKLLAQKDILAMEGKRMLGTSPGETQGMPLAVIPHDPGTDSILFTIVAYSQLQYDDPSKSGGLYGLATS